MDHCWENNPNDQSLRAIAEFCHSLFTHQRQHMGIWIIRSFLNYDQSISLLDFFISGYNFEISGRLPSEIVKNRPVWRDV